MYMTLLLMEARYKL